MLKVPCCSKLNFCIVCNFMPKLLCSTYRKVVNSMRVKPRQALGKVIGVKSFTLCYPFIHISYKNVDLSSVIISIVYSCFASTLTKIGICKVHFLTLVDLHLIFEISSLRTWFLNLIFELDFLSISKCRSTGECVPSEYLISFQS